MSHDIIDLHRRARLGDGRHTLRMVRASPPGRLDDTHVAQVMELLARNNASQAGSPPRTDFNAQLLALALAPEVRASLGSTLQRLVAAGLLVCHTQSEYSLTESGVRSMRQAPGGKQES